MKASDLIKGGKYNWKNQPERLVYLGMCEPRNGRWHQFALIDEPDGVWCEVLASDLEHFEETPPAALEDKLTLENAPLGTKAPCVTGGGWTLTDRGWRWGKNGSRFPRPGADWNGELIAPPAGEDAKP